MPRRKAEARNAIEAKRPCASNALDFNSLPLLQSAVEHSHIVEYTSLSVLPSADESPIEFRIDKTDYYTDLDRTYLYLQVQILNKDGSNLEATDPCTFINNIGYGIFDSVDVYISDECVTKKESYYAWWTYVYNLLFYSRNASHAYLEKGNLWYPDSAYAFDKIELLQDGDGLKNEGLLNRQSVCGDSKKVWLCTKLLLNTQLTRLIPRQTEISLRCNRSPTRFCLLASKDKAYQIKILDAKLHVNRVKLFEAAAKDFEKTLCSPGYFYPGTNPVVRTKTVSKGDQNIDWTPFGGKLPQRIYMWMISQEAYNGEQNRNPYNFQTFDVSKMQFFVNGRSVPYSQGISQIEGDDSSFLKFYMTTLMSINSPETMKINYYDYPNGFFIVAVDVSSDFSAGCDYDNIDEVGSLRVVVDFTKPLEEAITLFCLGEVQETLKLDGDRKPQWI